MLPTEGADARDIHELARRAVGHRRVEFEAAGETDGLGDEAGEVADGEFFAGADVDMARLRITIEEHQAGLGEIVGVQEFAERRTRAPEFERRVAAELRLMHLADHRREHVGVLEGEVVARAVEIAGHRADEVAAMLGARVVAELDARDLGDRIGFVRDLERTGQQGVFADGLRRELRVDAARTQEEQLAHAR